MKIKSFFILGFFFLFSCSAPEENKKQENAPKEKTTFQLYEASEMTALMEYMYANNKKIKEKISNEDFDFGNFPEKYLDIFTAKLTDSTDRDDFLAQQAHLFIDAQKLVYETTQTPVKNFNAMVDACIQCHQKKCSGPIERIRKLYINEN